MQFAPDHEHILSWLRETNSARLEALWTAAGTIQHQVIGPAVYLRGLIEIGNVCRRSCSYCGINRSVKELQRYRMNEHQIRSCIDRIASFHLGTVVLQGGEDTGIPTDMISRLVQYAKKEHDLAVTLSLGERELTALETWKKAGADRYLLKFESSNPDLFARYHPGETNAWDKRIEAIRNLHQFDYEVGTGFMIGLPGQRHTDLANDLLLCRELKAHMAGCGPFIDATGIKPKEELPDQVQADAQTTVTVMAVLRLLLPALNIPVTTAFQTIGRNNALETGLRFGANVVMPAFTPQKFRSSYCIYPRESNGYAQMDRQIQKLSESAEKAGRQISFSHGRSAQFLPNPAFGMSK
jgi:biotin synthase